METTKDYFDLDLDTLLETNEYGYTKEENLLYDSGLKVIFFDDMNEFESEKEDVIKYAIQYGYEIKDVLKTINERIAVILN